MKKFLLWILSMILFILAISLAYTKQGYAVTIVACFAIIINNFSLEEN